MKWMLFRLFAFLISGAFFGYAGWLVLSKYGTGVDSPVTLIVIIVILGVISAVVLLKRANVIVAHGIRINSPLAVALMDSVCVMASTTVSLFLIDGYSIWHSANSPLIMNDPIALEVTAFMYLPSALVLAFFVTSTGSQSVGIDESGLVIASAFGTDGAKWTEVENLSPHEQYVVVSRLGFPIPRHLRTNLVVTTNENKALTVYQPEFKSTKREILYQLRSHAPSRLQDDLTEMENAWL